MTHDYRQPFGFNKKKNKEVRSFISTFPKEYSGYAEEFDCFDTYYFFIKEPYHKPNHERCYVKFSEIPPKRSNSYRHVAAYCCPGAYWYKPYTKPRDPWGSLSSSENGKDRTLHQRE